MGGKLFHVDAGGIARSFKVYNNLVSPAATNTITGGGGGVNFNFEVLKGFHLIANSFYGDGVGRYIGGLGPDVIVKADGTLSAVHAGSGVAGFEWQATPNFLVDGYYSGAYFWRNYALTTKALGTPCELCIASVLDFPARRIRTIGTTRKPPLDSYPRSGRVRTTESCKSSRSFPTWFGRRGMSPGSPKNAHAFISYVNLRYILP